MSHTTKLLDLYRAKLGIRTDMAAAEALGITRGAVSSWRHELRHAEADAVAAMCEATGEPLQRWLPLVEAERARTPAARKAWLRLAQAAAAITLTVLAWRHGSDTQALALFAAAPLDIMRN